MNNLLQKIDALLPQTQCGRCNYTGCEPYAEAIACGQADINQCPPGGQQTIDNIAALLKLPSKPLNTEHGEETDLRIVNIQEEHCIGCVKCIHACPVDAIVGAPKLMHSVIDDYCTGCELCIPPCPVDCIELVIPDQDKQRLEHDDFRAASKQRYQNRQNRLNEIDQKEQTAVNHAKTNTIDDADKKAFIAAAVARSRAKKGRA